TCGCSRFCRTKLCISCIKVIQTVSFSSAAIKTPKGPRTRRNPIVGDGDQTVYIRCSPYKALKGRLGRLISVDSCLSEGAERLKTTLRTQRLPRAISAITALVTR